MATYRPGITSAALGGLLRLAQQEKDTQPHRIPPSAQVESPVRAQVQAPLTAPESIGSQKIVAMKPELGPGAEIPSPAGGVVAPRPDMLASAGVVPPGAPGSIPSSGPASAGGPSIMGASVSAPRLPSTLMPSAVRGSAQTGRLQVNPVPQMNVSVPAGREAFPDESGFQSAQTKTQNILGGLGKYGSAITGALNLPQLLPGGAFKKLQDIMAPRINKLLPNFNFNKA